MRARLGMIVAAVTVAAGVVVLDQAAGGTAPAAAAAVPLGPARLPADFSGNISAVSVSGGRVVFVDDADRPDGSAHSIQAYLRDGTPQFRYQPADVGLTSSTLPGVVQAYPHGGRTVLQRADGRTETYSDKFPASFGMSTVPVGAEVVGTDGYLLVYRDGTGHHLNELMSSSSVEARPSDVDGGYDWTATAVAGQVTRVSVGGGSPEQVLPADPSCPITSLQAREGDLLLRCASGEGRIHGPDGARLLTFTADEETRLGSGVLWRVTGGMLTATAYRTPGAAPATMFPVGSAPYAVDREGPWAVTVGSTGRLEAWLVPGVAVPPVAGRYVPRTTPVRVLDTRTTGGPVRAGADRAVTIPGQVLAATSVVLSVTVTAPTTASWLSVYPQGPYPGSSTLNFAAGQTVTTQVVVPTEELRSTMLRVGAGSAHVVLDLIGQHAAAVTPGASGREHVEVAPVRVLDTRPGAPVAAGSPRTVDLNTVPGVARPAAALVLNVTVLGADRAGYLSVSGAAGKIPTTVSYEAGRATAAAAIVAPASGRIVLTVGAGTADVLVDVSGYVQSSSVIDDPRLTDWYATTPTRLLDTRTGAPVAAGTDRRVQVAGVAGVPRGARAVVLTVTATRPTASSHVSAYPTGIAPTTSTLNFPAGRTVANTALVQLAPDGSISLRVGAGTAHVLLDVGGYLKR